VNLVVVNTNREFIDELSRISGTGRIRAVARNPRHSAAWTWTCHGDNSLSLLKQIFPRLIIKREAAEVALGLREATEPPWSQRTITMRAWKENEGSSA